MDKKWYILEHHAEGDAAELALLTEEEAKLFEKILNYTDDTVEFYDEGYAGCMEIRIDLGGFDTKKEAIKNWLDNTTKWDYYDLVNFEQYSKKEWLDQFEEDEE